jgi:hypothetical protein
MERIEGGRHQRAIPKKPAPPPPPEPWWSKHFVTILLIGAAAGVLWYVATGSSKEAKGPRPVVEFADIPVVTRGLTCNAETGILQIVRTDSAIRNVGSQEARSVVQWPIHAVRPETSGEPAFPLAGATCSSGPPGPMPAITLNANATLNQFLAPEKSTFAPVAPGTPLNLYTTVCATYTNAAGTPYGTCATYQFVPSAGGTSFTCEAPVNGTYRLLTTETCDK